MFQYCSCCSINLVFYCIIIIAHPTRHLSAVGAVVMELEDDDCGYYWHPNNHHCAGKVLTCNRIRFTHKGVNNVYDLNMFVPPKTNKTHKDIHTYEKEENNWPISGTESDVAGIISATISMKTVRESRTVMPGGRHKTSGSCGLQRKNKRMLKKWK